VEKIKNRIFALYFFVTLGLWMAWEPIFGEIVGYTSPGPWYSLYLAYFTIMVGYPIVLFGLAYEIYRPSLNFELDRDWKWILIGALLLVVAAATNVFNMFWNPFEPGFSPFGFIEFEFPKGSGQVYVWPKVLWNFFLAFCLETMSFSLLFGILFLTKSTPQTSKSYKIMLIGMTQWGIIHMVQYTLYFFFDLPACPWFSGIPKMRVLTMFWFHLDFWSELLPLIGAVRLLKKGKRLP